jgi:serine/threonine protein kinase
VEGRQRLLRAICRGLLSALSYCHSRGVAHCSLGPGSVLLNSVQEADVWRLLVKLDNWGLARVYPAALPGEVPGEGQGARTCMQRRGLTDRQGAKTVSGPGAAACCMLHASGVAAVR